jgi:hypothetical protein
MVEGQVFRVCVAALWGLAFPQLDGSRGVRGSGPARAEHSNACTITPPSPQLSSLIWGWLSYRVHPRCQCPPSACRTRHTKLASPVMVR